jgi:HK97 family phage major capsid protein
MKLTSAQAAALAESAHLPMHRVTDIARDCADMAELGERLKDVVKLEGLRPPLGEGAPRAGQGALSHSAQGFASFGDFLQVARFSPADGRLVQTQGGTDERAMSMGTGAAGGFLVPQEFSTALVEMAAAMAVVRPRARVLPATPGTPDVPITLPVVDQSGVRGLRSGVTVHWTGEGQTKQDTEPALKEVTLTPHEVSAITTLTDKLMRNAAIAGEIVSFLLAEAIKAEEDACFIQGDGVGKPLGFLNHASSIQVPRTGAGHIVFADIANMLMAARAGRPYVWLGSRTILGDLLNLTLTGGVGGTAQPIWLPSAYEGVPSTLLGLPILEPESQPILGAQGDLCLVDLGYYCIKDGYGIEVKLSDAAGTNFAQNRTSIRACWNVDGQPWLSSPILLPNGQSASPFVVLAA